MKALHYQCAAGISGDMHLGALVDLGVPEAHLRESLARLPCAEEFEIVFRRTKKKGIAGLQAQVRALAEQPPARRYRDIERLIQSAGYARGVEDRALAAFEQLAVAEAKIHGIPVEQVHFHEVGAIDAIVDMVGAAICLEYLDAERILCGVVELGGGSVDCAHGRFPVPVPATQEILRGAPCSYGGAEGECATPTGAAILKANVDVFEAPSNFAVSAIGYGIGHRDFSVPNVLRVALGELRLAPAGSVEQCKIEANIDDMSPEAYEPLIEHLLSLGASDVYCAPIVMKKSRPATCLTLLCEASAAERLAEAVLNRSSSIGVRLQSFVKRALPRKIETVETRFGPVRVKVVKQPDGQERWKSEFDDVRRIAEAQGADYLQTKAAIDRDIAERRAPSPRSSR